MACENHVLLSEIGMIFIYSNMVASVIVGCLISRSEIFHKNLFFMILIWTFSNIRVGSLYPCLEFLFAGVYCQRVHNQERYSDTDVTLPPF